MIQVRGRLKGLKRCPHQCIFLFSYHCLFLAIIQCIISGNKNSLSLIATGSDAGRGKGTRSATLAS